MIKRWKPAARPLAASHQRGRLHTRAGFLIVSLTFRGLWAISFSNNVFKLFSGVSKRAVLINTINFCLDFLFKMSVYTFDKCLIFFQNTHRKLHKCFSGVYKVILSKSQTQINVYHLLEPLGQVLRPHNDLKTHFFMNCIRKQYKCATLHCQTYVRDFLIKSWTDYNISAAGTFYRELIDVYIYIHQLEYLLASGMV